METESSSSTLVKPNASASSPVIIDLGKKRRKKIKDLRKGKSGKLLEEVNATISALKAEGALSSNAQPVIVVVRERRRKGAWPGV
jgi:hypothetical protein